MALNWAMIDATGTKPVPLPEEKIFLAVEKCQMSLEFKTHKSKWEAKGTVYVTNQRVVFLRQPALPPVADQSQASEHLRSLNMPLNHLVDCRYMIPVLAAPYYEAGVIPVPGGNLPEATPGGPTVKGILKIWFLEGRGATFRDAVEEVRNLSKGAQHGEQLPAYQPQTPGTPGGHSVAPSVAATADSSIGARTAIGGNDYATSDRGSSIRAGGPSSTRPPSGSSNISPDDLEAARVAMAQEEEEREAIRQQAERSVEPSASGVARESRETSADDGRPPAYDVVSPVTTFVPSTSDQMEVDSRPQDDRSQSHQVSTRERAKRRGRRMRAAAAKAMETFEGRDRILQLIHGLALLVHNSFGSVKHPRSYGLYPVPHILFFLFPRRIRRRTLHNVHLAGELVDKWRKLLILLSWCAEIGVHIQRLVKALAMRRVAAQCGSLEVKGKEREEEKDDAIVHEQESLDLDQPSISRRCILLSELGEVLMLCCDAAEVAAVVGGSSILWRIARAGYAESGQRALRYRQRQGLEQAAMGFAIIGLLLQLLTSHLTRRQTRKCLGRTHRKVLLLTDELTDWQLHTSEPSDDSRQRRRLALAEDHFQSLRMSMKRIGMETMTYGSEFIFASYEFLFPFVEKERIEAWSEIIAGISGVYRVLLV